jgi:hypothetical protein
MEFDPGTLWQCPPLPSPSRNQTGDCSPNPGSAVPPTSSNVILPPPPPVPPSFDLSCLSVPPSSHADLTTHGAWLCTTEGKCTTVATTAQCGSNAPCTLAGACRGTWCCRVWVYPLPCKVCRGEHVHCGGGSSTYAPHFSESIYAKELPTATAC